MEAILIIGGFYSNCSACHKNADPGEESHVMETMEGEGCGAKFIAMASEYGDRKACELMRPDLPYRGWDKADLL